MRQVGFWRAQLEVLSGSIIIGLVVYLLTWVSAAPWAELCAIGSLAIYAIAAWRLAAGTGSRAQRLLRILAWISVCALFSAAATWAMNMALPYGRPFMGLSQAEVQPPFAQAILASLLIIFALFGFGRAIRWLQHATRTRLHWQLTYGFLLVSTVTVLVAYLAIGLYLGIYSVAVDSPVAAPQAAAERLSVSLAPLVQQGDPSTLQASLQAIIDGTARIPMVLDTDTRPDMRHLAGIQRLLLITPTADGGIVRAAAGIGAPITGPLADDTLMRFRIPLADAYQRNACVVAQPATGIIPDSAICPIHSTTAFILVETVAARQSAQFGAMIGRTIAIASASLAVALGGLLLSSMVVLLAAGLVGYVLSRRITGRIERVAQATTALAHGERRMLEDRQLDEIGSLTDNFNRMADQLAHREEALRIERDRAERLLDANRRLVANISHELRTPLATLRGYLEALQQSHASVLPDRDMEIIHGEADRLTRMVDDLFTLTRAEARQLPLQLEPVHVGSLVARLVDTMAPLARRQRSLELVATPSMAMPPIQADPIRLEQVLRNLVQNAIRHTPTGGIIVLETALQANTLVISVADTGEGIAPADLPFVFERFYRGDASRSRETGGAGLGLALVRELTEAMNGTVTVTSELGRGSCFTLKFPTM